MMMPVGRLAIIRTFPKGELLMAMNFVIIPALMGPLLGPTVGGLIISLLSWHWIFFVNVPLGMLALFLVWRYIPPLKPKAQHERFDFAGAAVLGLGLLAFLLALTAGQRTGFTASPIVVLFVLAAVSLIAFIAIERRVRYPMIDLRLFRNIQFSLNLVTGFLTFVAIAAVTFLMPFYLELVMMQPVAKVGLLIAVVPLVLAVLGPLSGSLSDRFGTRPVSVVGLILLVIGYVTTSTITATIAIPLGYILRTLPIGLGMGVFQSPNNSAIMGAAPRTRLGIASSMLSLTRTLGQTAGIAVMGAFFASRLNHYAGQPVDITDAPAGAMVAALHDQFLVMAAVVGLGLVLALWAWQRERKASATQITAPLQPDL